MMYLLFAGTMFLSAALLFCVQPLLARLILPLLGGSPAVWNTCMVFFQAVLLAGYLYAHAATAWLGVRRQALLHAALVWVPLLVLPLGLVADASRSVPSQGNPIPWLLGVLLASVGLPFFVVSTTAPLLQKWFAGTGHPAAHDPYFLYSASNLGSILALLSYPFLLEPLFTLKMQGWLWTAGYVLLACLIAVCALFVWRARPAATKSETNPGSLATDHFPLTTARRLRWVALAFVPSSLMLGVTLYISTDIAAIPLLWVIPLALYLLSFILVFASRPPLPHYAVSALMPMVVLGALVLFLLGGSHSSWPMLGFHLLAFFVVALFCHGELAQDRPPAAHLTEFYLWLSVGGVLGGLFNTLVPPLLFTQVSVAEYPLVLVFACLLLPVPVAGRSLWARRWLDVAVPLAFGASTVAIFFVWKPPAQLGIPLLVILTGLCYPLVSRPLRLALSLLMILVPLITLDLAGHTLHRERTFFGLLRVTDDPDTSLRKLMHGSTMHGIQDLRPERRGEPLAYYHRTGPIGQVFEDFNARAPNGRVAAIGLGVGALACYAQPGQDWTFFEIDPAVVRIARNPDLFTYLADCKAHSLQIVLGDARLQLAQTRECYDLIVLDAFSSDSIPVHLLTAEALGVYLEHLAPGGSLAFHISNRYLDLKPVLADLASTCPAGPLICYARDDVEVSEAETKAGKLPSQWVVMARAAADLGPLTSDPRWQRLPERPGATGWTDDFSNILSVFRWQ